jgi:hypothetical protein
MTSTRTAGRVQLSAEVAGQVREQLSRVRDEWASHPLDVGAIAERVRLLPLLLDMGGFIGLDVDGRLSQVAWDEPEVVRPVRRLREQDLALASGSQKYAFLAALLPQRPLGTNNCSTCGGSGVHPIAANGGPAVACACGGLGWIPPDWESP